MFLELHLSDNNEKIMLNIDRIKSIYQDGRTAYVYVGEVVYRVKESYEDIAKSLAIFVDKAESEDMK